MKAIVLAAGYATRLYPITIDYPKHLLEIAGRPIIDYIIEKIEKLSDIDEIIIVVNDKFYMDFVWVLERYKGNKKIELINDGTTSADNRLGAIGDLWLAIEKKNINEDMLVVLGDNLFDFSLNDMVDFYKSKRRTTVGVYKLGDKEQAKRFGVVEIEGEKIVGFEEKPENPKTDLVGIGIYLHPKDDIKKIEEYLKINNPKDAPGNLIKYLVDTQDVYGCGFNGKWYDIGTQEVYEEVNNSWGK